MGIFSRFSDIVNSNLNSLLEKAEDPEKLVRLMIQEMEDTLVEVRSAAARAIADKKELTRKLEAISKDVDEWHRKAELAVSKGRDDLAKAALAEKARVTEMRDGLQNQFDSVTEGLEQLNDDIGRLEDKLADAKARQKALIVRHKTATNRLEVRKQIHDNKIDDALVRFEQFERRMESMEGRVEAYDMGRGKDLRREFTQLEDDTKIDEQLNDLKRDMASKSSQSHS
ncbi:MAG: phage shock protein PspA [Pseudomonadota bacterium]